VTQLGAHELALQLQLCSSCIFAEAVLNRPHANVIRDCLVNLSAFQVVHACVRAQSSCGGCCVYCTVLVLNMSGNHCLAMMILRHGGVVSCNRVLLLLLKMDAVSSEVRVWWLAAVRSSSWLSYANLGPRGAIGYSQHRRRSHEIHWHTAIMSWLRLNQHETGMAVTSTYGHKGLSAHRRHTPAALTA
jgi:hypothetical protein